MYNLLALLLLVVTSYEVNAEPAIVKIDGKIENIDEYRYQTINYKALIRSTNNISFQFVYKEGAESGYRPGFTNDDLMKLVFQRYGKSEVKGDSEKVNKREASEPVPDDEEDINQKRAYPRPVPGSDSILAKHSEVSFKKSL